MLFLNLHKNRIIREVVLSASQATFFDYLTQNVTDSFAVSRAQLVAFIKASVCGFLLFHCSIENIRAKAFECEVMLLHGDVLLNEDTELRVGILHRYWVIVGCHRLYCFIVWCAAGCKDREGALLLYFLDLYSFFFSTTASITLLLSSFVAR